MLSCKNTTTVKILCPVFEQYLYPFSVSNLYASKKLLCFSFLVYFIALKFQNNHLLCRLNFQSHL